MEQVAWNKWHGNRGKKHAIEHGKHGTGGTEQRMESME